MPSTTLVTFSLDTLAPAAAARLAVFIALLIETFLVLGVCGRVLLIIYDVSLDII